jgi:4-hydroxy-3-polyprenylbenzoate decarboxylase
MLPKNSTGGGRSTVSYQDVSSVRSTLDCLRKDEELLEVNGEVDPIYEIAGIIKALEEGPALLFNNIKGFPGARNVGNLFSRGDRVGRMFGAEDAKGAKFKCVEAIRRPIPPVVVKEAPCQEVVLDRDIDAPATLPLIKHTEEDAGRLLGGGVILLSGDFFRGGHHISFNRMSFRGRDWSSLSLSLSSHFEASVLEHRGHRIPITVNIGAPPAVAVTASGGYIHAIVPAGTDELAIAGGLQGSPVEIVRARTVDAYALAQAEWVVEGYYNTQETVWESEEAERLKRDNAAPFFPEFTGYMGRARRTYKFEITAITHRKDRPVFYTPLAHSFECDYMSKPLNEACFYELADRLIPGLVVDVNILHGQKIFAGVVFQVKKRRRRDDGYQRNLLTAAFGVMPGLRLAVVVDDDVDIYSAEDVIWAITTRVNPNADIVRGSGARGGDILPTERRESVSASVFEGGLGFDATVPLDRKWLFQQGKYPVDRIDLRKWFSEAEIAAALAQQSEYARVLARRGS